MGIFNKIFRFIKRAAIFFLILATISSIIYTVKIFRAGLKKINFSAIIDSDTGNGIDEFYTLARILADPGFEVIGLTSVQWNSFPKAVNGTAGKSQEFNDTLLNLFRRQDIPHPRGGEEMLGYLNQQVMQHSEAADFIIKKAHEVSKGRKLNIIALGALTNLASAVLLDSSIVPKLRIYTLVMNYDPATKVWNKNETNARNDLDALDVLLNRDGLELHIMPASAAKTLDFGTEEISDLMKNKGSQWNYLLGKWNENFQGEKDIMMPDVALIEAILHPDYAKEEQGITPSENNRKSLYVYTWINKQFMTIDYWKTIKNYNPDR